ncbi:MAG: hypothetical protein IOD12_09265, partial [Silvanigrellales bacterium]|nr:hypothetical protein [Silvanigrellales bacterium]
EFRETFGFPDVPISVIFRERSRNPLNADGKRPGADGKGKARKMLTPNMSPHAHDKDVRDMIFEDEDDGQNGGVVFTDDEAGWDDGIDFDDEK